VIVYFRNVKDKYGTEAYQLCEWVEGDATMYSCPSSELREQITNEIAYYYWRMQEQDWVRHIETFDDQPEELKGPYRP